MGERFESLDGMRGICAFIVLLYHCDGVLITGHLVSHGWLCVDAFFVLSGFVLAHRYEADLGRKDGLKKYAQARFRRLVPTMTLGYLFSTFFFSVLYFRGFSPWHGVPGGVIAIAAILGMFLIPIHLFPIGRYEHFNGRDYPFDPPLWSLFGEFAANALYGLFLYRAGIRTLVGIVLLLEAVLWTWAFNAQVGWGSAVLVPLSAVRALAEFLAGVVLFRCFQMGRLRAFPSINPVLVFSVWFLLCSVPYNSSTMWFGTIVAILVVPLLMAFLVRSGVRTPSPFLWLGAISYPLYVSHFSVVWLALNFLPFGPRHSILWAIPMVAMALSLAWFIAKLTEKRRRHTSMLAEVPRATG